MVLSQIVRVLNGLINYGNPVQVVLARTFSKAGLVTISDRKSGVTVIAACKSSHMFGSTWFTHDYDVPGCPLRPADCVIDIGANQGFFLAMQHRKVPAFTPSNPPRKVSEDCGTMSSGTVFHPPSGRHRRPFGLQPAEPTSGALTISEAARIRSSKPTW